MIASTHLAVGAVSGLWGIRLCKIKNFYWALATAFVVGTASHLLCDSIPHNERIYNSSFDTLPVLLPELAVVSSVIFWIVYRRRLSLGLIFAGIAGAAWMDAFSMINKSLGGNSLLKPVVVFHDLFHSPQEPNLIFSLTVQAVIAVVFLKLLHKFSAEAMVKVQVLPRTIVEANNSRAE